MNILVWATTFGADLWSFTKYASERPNVKVKVVLDNPEAFMKQGVADLFPLDVDFITRRAHHYVFGVPFFKPDVTIMDNRTPLRKTSPCALMLWHGFGWKGPNDEKELWWLHKSLKRLWGDVRVPNSDFRWQCFGPWDLEHRSEISRIHKDNCRVLGAASHDDLRVPLDRSLAQPYYPFDIVNRKTILIAPTWHYGEIFAHWGTDAVLLERLIAHIETRDANVILRLHDSYRFEKTYRVFLDHLIGRHPYLILKYKDQDPDNSLDLQVADVLITNFSSIANLFYATGRPTIHIYPVRNANEEIDWRHYTVAGIRTKKVERAHHIWKLPPVDNGGLLSYSFDEVIEHVDEALENPECCRELSETFLKKHMLGADGNNCERIWDVLTDLVRNGAEHRSTIHPAWHTSGGLDR